MATEEDGYEMWRTLIPVALFVAWGWALLTPLIYRVTRRLLPSRVGWPLCISGHTIVAAIVAVVVTALRIRFITWMQGLPFPRVSSFEERILFWSDVNLFTYLAIVSMGRAIDSFRHGQAQGSIEYGHSVKSRGGGFGAEIVANQAVIGASPEVGVLIEEVAELAIAQAGLVGGIVGGGVLAAP